MHSLAGIGHWLKMILTAGMQAQAPSPQTADSGKICNAFLMSRQIGKLLRYPFLYFPFVNDPFSLLPKNYAYSVIRAKFMPP